MSKITELNDATFAEFTGKGVTLVDYWATWCGPCKMVAPVLEQVADKLDGQARLGKVNVDECPDLARQADVNAIPNMCIYKDGALVDRIIGVQPLGAILKTIKKQL